MNLENFYLSQALSQFGMDITKGILFARNFEEELYRIVTSSLEERQLQNDPIILHGQTGTGKTVALGSIAYRVRDEGKYPVLLLKESHNVYQIMI